MDNLRNIILQAADTPIGRILDLEKNSYWPIYLAYAIPHVGVGLPVLSSIKVVSKKYDKNLIETLVASLDSDSGALRQLEDKTLLESYLLAQRAVDKLAIAVYTLYLYGRESIRG